MGNISKNTMSFIMFMLQVSSVNMHMIGAHKQHDMSSMTGQVFSSNLR